MHQQVQNTLSLQHLELLLLDRTSVFWKGTGGDYKEVKDIPQVFMANQTKDPQIHTQLQIFLRLKTYYHNILMKSRSCLNFKMPKHNQKP